MILFKRVDINCLLDFNNIVFNIITLLSGNQILKEEKPRNAESENIRSFLRIAMRGDNIFSS